jgi:hypothetical protein
VSENPYDQLLRDFQEAYAEFGHAMFFLGAMTQDEVNADREHMKASAEILAFVPLGVDHGLARTPGFWIVAPLRRHRWGRWAEPWEAPFNRFQELASRAGAMLPLAERERIPFPPADPVGWWLCYMWWQSPPTEEDLRAPDGVTRNTRVIWAEPFLESAIAIERGRLCSSSDDATRHPEDWVPAAEAKLLYGVSAVWLTRHADYPGLRRDATAEDRKYWKNSRLQYLFSKRVLYELTEGTSDRKK